MSEEAPLHGRLMRPRFWWFGRLRGSCPECGQRVEVHHSCPQQTRCEACGAQLALRSGPIQPGPPIPAIFTVGTLYSSIVGPTLYSRAAVEARWRFPGKPSLLAALWDWLVAFLTVPFGLLVYPLAFIKAGIEQIGRLLSTLRRGPPGSSLPRRLGSAAVRVVLIAFCAAYYPLGLTILWHTVRARRRGADVTLTVVTVGGSSREETAYAKTTTRSVVMNWGRTCCTCFERPAAHYEEEGRDASGIRRLEPGGKLRTIDFAGVPYCRDCYRKAYDSPARFLGLLLFPLFPVFVVAYFLVGTHFLDRHFLSRAHGVLVRDYDFGCGHWVRLFFRNRDYAEWFVAANGERLIWAK